MELKEGMYIRFDYHRVTVPIQISKIKEKHYEDIEKYYYYLTDNGLVISEEQIIKASYNIIDLIEVGDYVNGHRVNYISRDRDYFNLSFGDENYILKSSINDDLCWVAKKDIKSIVTKEQFESMSYKVGE